MVTVTFAFAYIPKNNIDGIVPGRDGFVIIQYLGELS
jgi:hypothetical protein